MALLYTELGYPNILAWLGGAPTENPAPLKKQPAAALIFVFSSISGQHCGETPDPSRRAIPRAMMGR